MPEVSSKSTSAAASGGKSAGKLADAEHLNYGSLKNDRGQSMLHVAAKLNHLEMVKLMIAEKMDLEGKCKAGRTPLHYAVEGGHDEVVRVLLESGSSPNAADNNGDSPLHLAAASSRSVSLRLLIKSGADINLSNSKNQTPSQLTVDEEMKKHLLIEGSNQV